MFFGLKMIWIEFLISLQGHVKEFGCIQGYSVKLMEAHFILFYEIFLMRLVKQNILHWVSVHKQWIGLLKIKKPYSILLD